MIERPFSWPRAKLQNVDPEWWSEVMQNTSRYNEYFPPELSDADDFTIRSIVHVITQFDQKGVEWFFGDSSQSSRIDNIHKLIHAKELEDRQKGKQELAELINDFTMDAIESTKQ